MAEPIDFYFDFSSPYGYLASTEIDGLAARHGRSVRPRRRAANASWSPTTRRSRAAPIIR